MKIRNYIFTFIISNSSYIYTKKNSQMIRDGINFMLVGIGITLFTIYLYFSLNEEKITNKFVLTVNKSYLFNWAPMIGITFMIFGEFLVWETQNNKMVRDIKLKLANIFKKKLSDLKTRNRFISILNC